MQSSNCHIKRYIPTAFSNYIDGIDRYDFINSAPVELSPGGYFELVFQTGGFYQSNATNESWVNRPKVFIGGLHNKSFSIRPENEKASLFSVRFKTGAAKNFIPDRLNLYKNKVVDVAVIFPEAIVSLAENVIEQANDDVQLMAIEHLLKTIFREKEDSPIDKAVQLIQRSEGCISIQELGNQVNLASSQFRKRFNEEVGMNPKAYSKIIRISAIQDCLNHGMQTKLTELAYRFNYFDQSHFIKDFKAVTGQAPKKYLQFLK